jgi:hypothetical protein
VIEGVSPDLPHTGDLPPGKESFLRLARPIARCVLRSYWRIKVHGSEHVPRTGPVILAANHLALLDGPVLVTETSHVDDARASWVAEIAHGSAELLANGVPIGGVCLYPILGMPEWHAPDTWTNMGLWDVTAGADALDRVLHGPMLEALRRVRWLDAYCVPEERRRTASGR